MTKLLVALLTFAAITFSYALASADEGLVFVGTCDDAGAWVTSGLKHLPAKAATGPLDPMIDAAVPSGVKLREITDGRPLGAKVIGLVTASSTVRLVALRVLGASPGAPHAVWAKVQVPADRVLKP